MVVQLYGYCIHGWIYDNLVVAFYDPSLDLSIQYTYVTEFEKTRLPHTQYQAYDFIRNALLVQCTIIFHCVPC